MNEVSARPHSIGETTKHAQANAIIILQRTVPALRDTMMEFGVAMQERTSAAPVSQNLDHGDKSCYRAGDFGSAGLGPVDLFARQPRVRELFCMFSRADS
jgi:hypothetical protein